MGGGYKDALPPFPPNPMMRGMRGGWGGMMDPYAGGMVPPGGMGWGGRRGGGRGRRSFPPHVGMPILTHPAMHHMAGRPMIPPVAVQPPPPPPGFVQDPRQLRTYVDLDAPSDGAQVLDYRTTVDYGDLASSDAPSSSSSDASSSSAPVATSPDGDREREGDNAV